MPSGEAACLSTQHALLSLAELLPAACRLLESDTRPEAQAWIRKAEQTALGVMTRPRPDPGKQSE